MFLKLKNGVIINTEKISCITPESFFDDKKGVIIFSDEIKVSCEKTELKKLAEIIGVASLESLSKKKK